MDAPSSPLSAMDKTPPQPTDSTPSSRSSKRSSTRKQPSKSKPASSSTLTRKQRGKTKAASSTPESASDDEAYIASPSKRNSTGKRTSKSRSASSTSAPKQTSKSKSAASTPKTPADDVVDTPEPRRSGRKVTKKRRTPEPDNDSDSEDPLANSPPPAKKARTSETTAPSSNTKTTRTTRKQPVRGNFSAEYLMKDPNSILNGEYGKPTVSGILSHPQAWSALTNAEKCTLLKLLPGNGGDLDLPEGIDIENVLQVELQNNAFLKEACTMFSKHLSEGRYLDGWLKKAAKAMKDRAAGTYDDWKERETEAFWGQKQKVDHSALAGDTAQYKLPDLVKAGLFEIGDVWRFERNYKKGAFGIRKEATVTAVDTEKGTLDFKYPPKGHEILKKSYQPKEYFEPDEDEVEEEEFRERTAGLRWDEKRKIRREEYEMQNPGEGSALARADDDDEAAYDLDEPIKPGEEDDDEDEEAIAAREEADRATREEKRREDEAKLEAKIEALRQKRIEEYTDKKYKGCDNPTPLLVAMMDENAMVDPKERMNNAWKLVRVFRNGQDLGALFDVRERHAVRAAVGK